MKVKWKNLYEGLHIEPTVWVHLLFTLLLRQTRINVHVNNENFLNVLSFVSHYQRVVCSLFFFFFKNSVIEIYYTRNKFTIIWRHLILVYLAYLNWLRFACLKHIMWSFLWWKQASWEKNILPLLQIFEDSFKLFNFIYFLILFTYFLRYSWYIILYKLQVYNIVIQNF